ncbi:MAG: response regulator [Anaerolineae bacterium]|nr:response regulator [Anaerolineae bacterium]
MDRTDQQIIALLRQDGRRSNVEIARELGISEGTVRKRIDRLISSGALRIVGIVDPKEVGYQTRALIFLSVELAKVKAIGQILCDMPEVINLYLITGEYDFVIDAVFHSDDELRDFLTQRLGNVPGILKSQTAHVLDLQKCNYDWILPQPSVPRILIVDDDPDFVEATRMILEKEGFEVQTASNGEEALKSMLVRPPSLVILDIMMEGVLDGWDASWRIRSNPQLHNVPILVVSSITASDYLNLFPTDEDNLIDNFLSKPVAPEKLIAEVRRLLNRH